MPELEKTHSTTIAGLDEWDVLQAYNLVKATRAAKEKEAERAAEKARFLSGLDTQMQQAELAKQANTRQKAQDLLEADQALKRELAIQRANAAAQQKKADQAVKDMAMDRRRRRIARTAAAAKKAEDNKAVRLLLSDVLARGEQTVVEVAEKARRERIKVNTSNEQLARQRKAVADKLSAEARKLDHDYVLKLEKEEQARRAELKRTYAATQVNFVDELRHADKLRATRLRAEQHRERELEEEVQRRQRKDAMEAIRRQHELDAERLERNRQTVKCLDWQVEAHKVRKSREQRVATRFHRKFVRRDRDAERTSKALVKQRRANERAHVRALQQQQRVNEAYKAPTMSRTERRFNAGALLEVERDPVLAAQVLGMTVGQGRKRR